VPLTKRILATVPTKADSPPHSDEEREAEFKKLIAEQAKEMGKEERMYQRWCEQKERKR
jgi:hypothetical protein